MTEMAEKNTTPKTSETAQPIVHSTSYNPCPETVSAGYAKTDDGFNIRYASWKSAVTPVKGTVILLHGRSEFIEKQYETVQDLREEGFEVLTFDWRGQGGSDRLIRDPRRGYIDNYDQYLLDLEAIMQQVALPDCRAPFFVMAHSTGSLVALYGARQFSSRIRRMVLYSPFLGIGKIRYSQSTVKTISGTLNALGLGETYMGGGATASASNPFLNNMVTSDEARYDRTAKLVDEFHHLSIGSPTASWLYASCQAMARVNDPEFHSLITTPILMISGANDQVVSNRATEHLGKRLRSGSNHAIAGAKHELLHEHDLYRQQALAAFKSFIPGSDEV